MKKSAIILFLLLIFSPGNTQVLKNNNLYLTFQPVDFGVGIRYDRKIDNVVGAYFSASYGKYRLPADGYIKDHLRFVLGGFKYMKPYNTSFPSLGVGLVYSYYGEQNITLPEFPASALYPFSFELCMNTKCWNRFAIGLRFDFMKNESAIDVGLNF